MVFEVAIFHFHVGSKECLIMFAVLPPVLLRNAMPIHRPGVWTLMPPVHVALYSSGYLSTCLQQPANWKIVTIVNTRPRHSPFFPPHITASCKGIRPFPRKDQDEERLLAMAELVHFSSTQAESCMEAHETRRGKPRNELSTIEQNDHAVNIHGVWQAEVPEGFPSHPLTLISWGCSFFSTCSTHIVPCWRTRP